MADISVAGLSKTYVVPEREGGVKAAVSSLVRRRTRRVGSRLFWLVALRHYTGASAWPRRRVFEMSSELELTDWRRQVQALYAAVRAEADPTAGHARWRTGRDELFSHHPQSPLPPDDPLRETGLPYWPYDPGLRFELELQPPEDPGRILELPSGENGSTTLRTVGRVELPAPVGGEVEVWWLDQYAGGLFLPLRDGSAGGDSYGGGRYLLDTAKGADLGGTADRLVVDLNFLYHPSCRYDDAWLCPLAPPANTISAAVSAGERMSAG